MRQQPQRARRPQWRGCPPLFFPILILALLLGAFAATMAAATAASASEAAAPKTKPVCEHEGGRLVLERPAGTENDAALTQQLSQRLHEALTEWSGGSLTGCRAEVVWKGASHCGTVFELPGAYHFHGHGAHLTLTSECAGTAPSSSSTTTNVEAGVGSSGRKARVVYLHSAHNVYLFHFTGGASIHARGIGFQGGTGKWGGAIELSGGGIDSDSDFTGCLFDSDQALSSGGAVVVEGAIDPDTAEPTTARFHDCSFTHNAALQGGALYVAPTKPGRARVELEGCTFEANEAYAEGGAVYVAGDLVLKGKRNRFSDNQAGHHDADIYVEEALGGRVLREKSSHEQEL